MTPLMIAASNGNAAGVKFLLGKEGINVNKVDRDGDDTALMLAASEGHFCCTRLLLNTRNIDIKHEDRFGQNCFTLARIHRRAEVLELLRQTCRKRILQDHAVYSDRHSP